jgi:periplasmic protein CpxP/Spy
MKLTKLIFTKRALLVGLLAGSGILAASSFAMTAAGSTENGGCEGRHGHKIHAQWEARGAEHLSELKGMLKLHPEQEAAWEAFASASQPETHFRRLGGLAIRGEMEKLNTPQRLDKMLAMADAHRAKLAERAEAIKAFYAQLTPEQQGAFDAEAVRNQHRDHERRHFHS